MEDKQTKVTIGNKVYNLEEKNDMQDLVDHIYKNTLLFPKVFPSVRKLIFLFVTSTCVTILIGVLISLRANDWLWFSRFGSVCIVIAVLFIFYDVSDYYDKKLRAVGRTFLFIRSIVEAQFDKLSQNPNLSKSQIAEIELVHRDALKKLDEQVSSKDDIEIRHEQQIQKSKLRLCEACILIVGTLIWGFGDLIGVLIKKY